MKNIALLLLTLCASALAVPTSQFPTATTIDDADTITFLDVSDTSASSHGTDKKITIANFKSSLSIPASFVASLTAPAAGITLTGSTGTITIGLANDLGAIEALAGTGYAKRTGSDAWALASAIPWADVSGAPSFITGNQTITLSGDVSGSGATAISVTIGNGAVTNAKLANSAMTIAGTSTSLGGSITASAILDSISSTRGVVLYRGASGWAALAPGTSGNFLKTQGAGADPVWAAASGGGSFDPASPGAIGGTTPAAGTFTTVAVDQVTIGGDAVLLRDAANTLALRNGANAQTFIVGNPGTAVGTVVTDVVKIGASPAGATLIGATDYIEVRSDDNSTLGTIGAKKAYVEFLHFSALSPAAIDNDSLWSDGTHVYFRDDFGTDHQLDN